MAPPIVDAIDSTVLLDSVISASSLFLAVDPNNEITSYTFQDFRSTAGGGYFSLDGTPYSNGSTFTIAASELPKLEYIGGSQVGFEGFRVIARDQFGFFSSPLSIAKIYSVRENTSTPHVRAPNFTALADEFILGSDFIYGFDPDGYPLTHYRISEANKVLSMSSAGGLVTVSSYLHRFETGDFVTIAGANESAYNGTRPIEVVDPHTFRFSDAGIADGPATGVIRASTEDFGYFEVDGVKMPQGQEFTITADQVDGLRYYTFGPDDEENIYLQGYDGVDWSYDKKGVAVTELNANRPVVQFGNVETPADQLMPIKGSFDVTDADGSSMKEYFFYNTSPHAQNGELIFQGVTMPRNEWFSVLASEMGELFFETSRVGFEQQIRVRATDGKHLSVPGTLTIRSTPPIIRPVIEVNQLVVVEEQLRGVLLAPLFSKNDPGNPHTAVEVYEPTASSGSGTLRNGVTPIAGDTIHQFSKAEFDNQLNFYTGDFYTRHLDTVYVRETNESGLWSSWEKIDVRTEPEYEDVLTSGADWNGLLPVNSAGKLEISFSFMQQFPSYATGEAVDNDPPEHFSIFTDVQRANARIGFRYLEEIANVQFVEVPDTSTNVFFGMGGIMRLGEYGLENSNAAAFAFYPGFGDAPGDMWFNRLTMGGQTNLNLTPGSFGYSAFLHELGHAMGLKHPHDGTPRLPPETDVNDFSIMSYQDADNGEPTTYQLYDVNELQDLYGANTSTRVGDDTYSIADFWGGRNQFVETIWDAGGNDTLSAVGASTPYVLDLRSGQRSSIGDFPGNVNIAFNVDIEHAVGNDFGGDIYGNGLDNILRGGAGDDMLMGNAGIDQLEGGAGHDTFVWGVGDDNDIINEQALAGRDTIRITEFPTVNTLEEDFRFRVIGRDLLIDLAMDGGSTENTLRVVNQEFGGYRIESLELAGTKIDLVNLHSQIAPDVDTFRVIADSTVFGQLVVPA